LTQKETELNPDSEDYYLYRRNECNQTSLRGENVKSLGEKIIADFLLEHDIRYSYEQSNFWGTKLYHPDFTLFDPSRRIIILEHWAINPADPLAQVPSHWAKTTPKYREEIEAKRDFWRKKNNLLLETNAMQVADLDRRGFEDHLRATLERVGFRCEKLSRKEIMNRVSDARTRKFVRLLGQCISLAKKAKLTPEDVRARYRSADVTDAKVRAFGSIAWRIYRLYEKRMGQFGLTDYDSLLDLAAHRVDQTQGDLMVQDDTRGHFHLQRLKWVLLDEYQDFSSLFDGMLRAISKCNPKLRTLCVGDNWQAINGFAGSDTKYIDCFEDLNQEDAPVRFAVPVNRRSGEMIVDAGNVLMKDVAGDRAISREGARLGAVEVRHVDDVYVELRKTREHQDRYEADRKYLVPTEKNGRESTDALASKYLKLVAQTIEADSHLSYSVLTRYSALVWALTSLRKWRATKAELMSALYTAIREERAMLASCCV